MLNFRLRWNLKLLYLFTQQEPFEQRQTVCRHHNTRFVHITWSSISGIFPSIGSCNVITPRIPNQSIHETDIIRFYVYITCLPESLIIHVIEPRNLIQVY